MIDRLLSALVAVTLAMLIWLYARSRDQEVLDHVPIPVEVTLGSGQSEQYDLEVVNPAAVLATFTGPPARIRELRGLLQRDRLRVPRVDQRVDLRQMQRRKPVLKRRARGFGCVALAPHRRIEDPVL